MKEENVFDLNYYPLIFLDQFFVENAIFIFSLFSKSALKIWIFQEALITSAFPQNLPITVSVIYKHIDYHAILRVLRLVHVAGTLHYES
jgi:hypothetical protein